MTSSRASAALCWFAAAIVSAGVCAPESFARDSAICSKHFLLVRRVTLHGLDEIWYQVIPPLQLVLHLRKLRLYRLFLRDKPVVRAARQQ